MSKDPIFAGGRVEEVEAVNLQLSPSLRPSLKSCFSAVAQSHQLSLRYASHSLIMGRKTRRKISSSSTLALAPVPHPIPSMITGRKRKTSSLLPAPVPRPIPSIIIGRKRKTSSSSLSPVPHPMHLEKKAKLMVNVNINDLPDFLLVEILCRLPSKEFVFQCTYVSKRWYTLISDNPYFIGRFLCLQRYQNRQTTPIVPSLIDSRGREFPTAKMLLPLSSTKFSAPSKSNNHLVAPVFKRITSFLGLEQDPKVIATCNDLILCCRTLDDQREYYICNPYTRQWVALPPTPQCKRSGVPVGFICDPYYYEEANGTLKINKDYRCTVVRILPHTVSSGSGSVEAFKFNLEIFSSETGEWRETVVSSPRRIMLDDMCKGSGFAYNGMLYWQIMGDAGMIGLGPFSNNNISSSASTTRPEFCFFDLVDERVSNERVQSIECIGVHRGCLRVWGWDQLDDDIIGWELKGVAGSGKLCVKHSRVYTVDPDIVPDVVEILAFDPSDDEDILYACNIDVDEEYNRYLAMYNIRTGAWSRIAIQDDPNDEDTYTGRLFQLVFPWWPTPVPRLSQPWLRPS